MARIRTIKPEYPQSESMGRVSRDARLLFVNLFTICDDAGRARGNSRMLASLLYPYDDDAKGLIDGWLSELVDEGCIVLYSVDGSHYLEVTNWLEHQKIDKPSKSKIPPFEEGSIILAKPLEPSSEDLDLGPGPGPGMEGKGEVAPKVAPAALVQVPGNQVVVSPSKRGIRLPTDWQPTAEQIDWAERERSDLDIALVADRFRDHWIAQPGQRGVKLDWDATWRNWVRNERAGQRKSGKSGTVKAIDDLMRGFGDGVA